MKKTIKNKHFLFLLTATITCTQLFSQKTNGKEMDKMWGSKNVQIDALKNGKGKFFDDSNFGMFIHWGLYSIPGGTWKGEKMEELEGPMNKHAVFSIIKSFFCFSF